MKLLVDLDLLPRWVPALAEAGIEAAHGSRLGAGVRRLPHGNYLIFCRERSPCICIERMMHGARDIGAEDFDATEPPAGQ